MIEPVLISDSDLDDVLFRAGLTPDEVEAEPEARQIAKYVLGAVTAVALSRLARRIAEEAMK